MYEGDTPNAERRAAALSLDRDLLRELLGQEELRDLIDPGALEQVEADLQHRSDRTRAATRDALHDVLRRARRPDARPRSRDRVLAGVDADALLADARARAARDHAAHRRRAALDRRRRRRPLPRRARRRAARRPARGVPRRRRATRSRSSSRRYARTHGPFTTAELRDALRRRPDAARCSELERAGDARPRRAAPRRHASASGATPRSCAGCAAPRSPCCARRSRPPTSARSPRFLPSWQGVDRHPAAGAGIDRLREVLVPLQGLALPADVWERDVLPRRTGAYSPTWMDQLCAARRGRLGRRRRARAQLRAGRAVLPRGRRGDRPAAVQGRRRRRRARSTTRSASASRAAPCFFTDLLAELALAPEELQEALWDLVWAGEVTNDAFAPLRAPRLTLARAQRDARATAARRPALRRRGAPARSAQVQGRWSLTAPLLPRASPSPASAAARSPSCCSSATASSRREQVLAEGDPRRLLDRSTTRSSQLETLGVCRRGYFVEGLGGAQFALPGAVERLRAQRGSGEDEPPIVLAATDPAQPYGAALPWPKRDGEAPQARSASPAPTSSSSAREPVLYLERGGRACSSLVEADDPRCAPALEALADVRAPATASRRLALERVDGEPVVGLRAGSRCSIELGFRPGPAQADPQRVSRVVRWTAMPEGDTIHYAANRIRPVLDGRVPDEIATPHPRFGTTAGPSASPGGAVDAVDAHGKHLFLRFEGDLVIHSHLRMTGAWGVYAHGRALAALAAARVARAARADGHEVVAVRRPGARAA